MTYNMLFVAGGGDNDSQVARLSVEKACVVETCAFARRKRHLYQHLGSCNLDCNDIL